MDYPKIDMVARSAIKKKRKPPGSNRMARWAVVLLTMSLLFVGYLLWSCLYDSSPRFNFTVISKDNETLKILNGESLRLHPKNRLKIMDISTDICFNRGVRLVSEGLDINSLLYREVSVAELLAERDIYKGYAFKVEVKQYNEAIGHFDLIVEPLVEDWLDRAERSIGAERKIAVLEQALRFAPDDRRIKDRLVKEYISLKKWEESALMLEEMAEGDQPDRHILLQLVEVYGAMSEPGKSVSVLQRLVSLGPDDVDIRIRLADTLEKAGRDADAIKQYEEVLNMMGDKDPLPVYKSLGFLYSRNKLIDNAISTYLKAVEMDKGDANLYYNLSLLYEQKGEEEKADTYLRKAVELRSGDIQGRVRLSEGLINRGKLDEAEAYLKEVLDKEPRSLEAWLLLAVIWEKRGNREALKAAYENILGLDPGNRNVVYNLGIIEYEKGNLSKSQSYLEKYIRSSPGDSDAHAFLFDIYKKRNKEELAFKEAKAIIRLKPKEIDYYHYIFEYLNGLGSYEEMAEVMEGAIKNNPKNKDIRKYLVVAYLNTGRDDLALEEIKEILNFTPDDITLLLQLARLQEKREDYEGALASYKRIIDISPENEEAKEGYLRLRLKVL